MKCILHTLRMRACALPPPPWNSGVDVHRILLLSRSFMRPLNPNVSFSIRSSSFFRGFSTLKISTRSAVCHAASPGSPPPRSDRSFPGLVDTTLSKFQDKVQIFFAVLFWMSLFFWACAWDGRNDGRPPKPSRLRR